MLVDLLVSLFYFGRGDEGIILYFNCWGDIPFLSKLIETFEKNWKTTKFLISQRSEKNYTENIFLENEFILIKCRTVSNFFAAAGYFENFYKVCCCIFLSSSMFICGFLVVCFFIFIKAFFFFYHFGY